MDSSTRRRTPFHIRYRARHLAIAGFAALAVVWPVHGPIAQIDSTVEEQLQDSVESDVTSSVEQELEEQIESDLTGAVEDEVQDQVESEVTGTVEDQVQDQVESDVAGTVEDQVQDQVESDVAGSVEAQVQGQVESDVTETVESDVTETLESRFESEVAADLAQTVEREIERVLGDQLGDELDEAVEQVTRLVDELGIEDVGAAIERAARFVDAQSEGAADGDAEAGDDGEGAEGERFVSAVDALGRTVEANVWVILVPDEHADRIASWGFTIRQRTDLDSLERILLRVDAPGDRDVVQAALELALDAPGTSVDFNHVYGAEAAQRETRAGGAVGRLPAGRPQREAARGLEIGIIDSRVASDHEALAGADIVTQEFVAFEGARPSVHGTAVASILVGDSGSMRGVLPGARLHAASVFFEDEAGHEIATTDGLVGAIEWLVDGGVDVVNMSLSGPPNRVLETALAAAAQRGTVVVAAVGNNGPSGEPLYPAAYEMVIGVTAVDATYHVYRYANRGGQVTFSAPGVDVPVAVSDGGYGTQTGTSMAAPHAAAMIARSLASHAGEPADGVLERLKATALDLGPEDFDEVYGYGLIATAD